MSKRPGYETAEDLERERRILTAMSEAWACQYEKTRIYYPADGVFVRGGRRVVAFVEVKYRELEWRKRDWGFDFLIFGVSKYCEIIGMSEMMCVPAMILFGFSDGVIARYDIKRPEDGVIISGRKDRGDSQDIEPCVVIKRSRLIECGRFDPEVR